MAKTLKDKLTQQILRDLVSYAECECDDGKGCSLCLALIALGWHSEWVIKGDKIVTRRKTIRQFEQATLTQLDETFQLTWLDEAHPTEDFSAKDAAIERYYVLLAYDYLGSAIRDNSVAEKSAMGKAIEKYGVDDQGRVIWK